MRRARRSDSATPPASCSAKSASATETPSRHRTLKAQGIEQSLPWIRRKAAETVRRFPELASFEDDLVHAFVLRWLEKGWPPLFEWVAIDLHRREYSTDPDWRGTYRLRSEKQRMHASYRPPFEARLSAAQLLRRLTRAQAQVLDRYYGQGWTLEEIAEHAGVTMQRIHQIRNRAVAAARGLAP